MYNNNDKLQGGIALYCMKCGTDTKSEQVFCDTCLAGMKQFPVKPGTPVQLPTRPAIAPKKNSARKKQITPEEQVLRLRGIIRRLAVGLVAVLLALGFSVSLLLHTLQQQAEDPEPNGKNYSTVDADSAG